MKTRHAQPVVVHVHGRDHVAGFVDSADEQSLTLVLSAPPEDVLDLQRVTVEFTTARGIHRVSGTVRTTREHPEVLELRRDGSAEILQRRAYVRVDAVVTAEVRVTDPMTDAASVSTVNISGGGVLLHDAEDRFGLGAHLILDLDLDGRTVRALGQVVRDGGDGRKGVELIQIDQVDRNQLMRFVTERERRALRVARGG